MISESEGYQLKQSEKRWVFLRKSLTKKNQLK